MVLATVLLPFGFALAAFLVPSDRWRPLLLPVLGVLHTAVVFLAIGRGANASGQDWIRLDALGSLLLLVVTLLFLACSFYAPSYLWLRAAERPNRIFCGCVALFLGVASLVALAQHLGLLWVAVEATTLVTAPLIYFNRNQRSIEATWKYLMICSVGIALALLGSFFLAYAAFLGSRDSSLFFVDLARNASTFSHPWQRAAFALLLAGYGTKMGLAPLHTWKPDAYGEAPGLVGALLAGGATSCAFVALLRVFRVVSLGGDDRFARRLLVGMGLFSLAYVAIFMARQREIKRMLAYSSVEQMGILAVGLGVGGVAPTLLHMINNGLAKGLLFLAAGNIHRAFGSKRLRDIGGANRVVPVSGSLFLLGFLALAGTPPFGPFVSLFSIVSAGLSAGRTVVIALLLLLVAGIFFGMSNAVLQIFGGEPPRPPAGDRFRDSAGRTAPLIALAAALLLLGVYIPSHLRLLLDSAASGLVAVP